MQLKSFGSSNAKQMVIEKYIEYVETRLYITKWDQTNETDFQKL